jgi:hypothetical protein
MRTQQKINKGNIPVKSMAEVPQAPETLQKKKKKKPKAEI